MEGVKLGTLCVIDTKPRQTMTADKRTSLISLAAMVSDQLSSRLTSKRLHSMYQELLEKTAQVEALNEELHSLINTANAPIFAIDEQLRVTVWNHKISQITSVPQEEVKGKKINSLLTALTAGESLPPLELSATVKGRDQAGGESISSTPKPASATASAVTSAAISAATSAATSATTSAATSAATSHMQSPSSAASC